MAVSLERGEPIAASDKIEVYLAILIYLKENVGL